MTNDHRHFAGWAAAYILGALDTDDRRSFENHLGNCGICAADLAALAPLPALIAKVERGAVDHHPDPAQAAIITAAAQQEVRALRRRSMRWQLVAAGWATAAMILAVAAFRPRDGDDDRPPSHSASVVSSQASTTDVAVSARPWGTEITLDLTGLPSRRSYQLWTIDNDGEWTSVATWLPTSTGAVRLTGATRIPTDRVHRVLITSNVRDEVLIEVSV